MRSALLLFGVEECDKREGCKQELVRKAGLEPASLLGASS